MRRDFFAFPLYISVILLYNNLAKLIEYCKLGIIISFGRGISFFPCIKMIEFDKMQIPLLV